MSSFGRTVFIGVLLYFLAGRVPFANGVLGWLALAWTGARYGGSTARATWTGAAAAGALAATLGVLANVFWLAIGAGLAPAQAAFNVYAIGVDLVHLLIAPLVGALCGVAGALAFGGRRGRPLWIRRRWWRL